MRSKSSVRIDGFRKVGESGHSEAPRVVYDGSGVMLVYEREFKAGEWGLFFETSQRTVRVTEYPSTWRQASDFDLIELKNGPDTH